MVVLIKSVYVCVVVGLLWSISTMAYDIKTLPLEITAPIQYAISTAERIVTKYFWQGPEDGKHFIRQA